MAEYAEIYLGDSVYAEFDGFQLVLMTKNGLPNDPSNIIYLEPAVLAALWHFAANNGLLERCKPTEP